MPKIPLQLNKEITDKYSVDNNTFLQVAKANPKDKIDVEIGDSKQADFLPQVKIQRWDNEVNYSARLIHDEKTPTVTTEADKILWKGDKVEAHFYDINNEDHPEGASEFEVVLKKKPKTNKVEFTLNTKGLDFFYQPALTPEEIAQGSVRPENVEGSYAVYASENKTNYVGGKEYKTGKVGHIFRPKIIDSAGTEVWGDLHIENGILSVTIPQDFLDKAVYPVRHAAGLTFGYTSSGGSVLAWVNQFQTGGYDTTVASGGTVSKIQVAAYNAPGTAHIKMALYDGTNPTNLIANSSTGAITVTRTTKPTQDSEWTSSTSVSASLAGSTKYWLAYAPESSAVYTCYDTGFATGTTRYGGYNASIYSQFPPATAPATYNDVAKHSIYATYTASGTTFPRTASATVSRAASRSASIARTFNALRATAATVSRAASRSITVSRLASFVRSSSVSVSNTVSRLAAVVYNKISGVTTWAKTASVSTSNAVSRLATLVRKSTFARITSASVSNSASRFATAARKATFIRKVTASVSNAVSRLAAAVRKATFLRPISATTTRAASRTISVARVSTFLRKVTASVSNTVSRFTSLVRKSTFPRALSASVSNTVSRLATLARKIAFKRTDSVSTSNAASRLASIVYNKIVGVTTFVKTAAVSISNSVSRLASVKRAQQLVRKLSASVSNAASRFATAIRIYLAKRAASVVTSNAASRTDYYLQENSNKLLQETGDGSLLDEIALRPITVKRLAQYIRASAATTSRAASRTITVVKAKIFVRLLAASVSNAVSRMDYLLQENSDKLLQETGDGILDAIVLRSITVNRFAQYIRASAAWTSTAAGRLVRISRLLLNGLADWYTNKFTKQNTSYSDSLTSQGTSYSDKLSAQSNLYKDKFTP